MKMIDSSMQWLMEAGGPVIRYRTARELAGIDDPARLKALSTPLLESEKTRWLLAQMDQFGPLTRVDARVFNALHGMKATCLENVIPRLIERGLHAGIRIFDEKMERFRQYVDNPLVRQALDDPENPTVEGGRAVFIAILLASYFLRAGYRHDEVLQFVARRAETISRVTAARDYSIYLPESERKGLPKQWIGKPILRPEMEPTSGSNPLPLIHDIYAFAFLPSELTSEKTRQQIENILAYVLDDKYRAFPWGYGYIWSKANPRFCYGCGWSVDLPRLGSQNPYELRKIVPRMELMAHFSKAHFSAWFQEGMGLLETFRTERGTYYFPPAYLIEQKDGYYVGGNCLGLEDNRKTATALELESTFRMLLIKMGSG